MKNYNWATLGCGVIANELAIALKSRGQKLYSVANRTHEKAVAFAEKYSVEKVYNDIDELFKDENVDIIYISTPHNTHIKYLRKALAAGKHVLCEKSITLNSDELDEAISLAEKNHVVLAEAMTIFHMPIYKALLEKVNSGDLGELRLIQMNFGSYKEYNMNNRFFNRNLAGGAMLDIGVYALSFIRMFMSSCPNDVLSQVKYAETGVDEQASILLKNKEEEMATVILSLHAKQPKRGTISFDKGYVEVFEYPRGMEAKITYTADGHCETISAGHTKDALLYEVEDMEKAIEGDSAMGAVKSSRDSEYQAIMPIRGKILNCLKADYARIFKSDVIVDLIKVMGCGVELGGKHNKELATFNLDNLRFNKIVICTDADVDGYQIRTLVLTMLYRLTPTLINKGYVYIAESPLYEITTKDRTYFAYTEPEKAAFLEKIGDKKYTIQRSKGLGENDPEMMWLTTMNPESRRLIKVMPTDVVQTAQVFDILLGDNLAGRKEHIAQHGAEYLDDLDVS